MQYAETFHGCTSRRNEGREFEYMKDVRSLLELTSVFEPRARLLLTFRDHFGSFHQGGAA